MPDTARKQARRGIYKANLGDLKARLGKLIEVHGGVRTVATASGIPVRTLYNYLEDDTGEPPATAIAAMCDGLAIDANELLGIDGPYVSVPLRDVRLDERGRAFLASSTREPRELHFRRDWLFRRDGREPAIIRERIFAFQTEHATMSPVREGDVIVVDGEDTREQKGARFLVLISGSATIVSLEPLLNSKIRMKNDDGDVEDIPRSDIGARLKNCGRVFWRGGKV